MSFRRRKHQSRSAAKGFVTRPWTVEVGGLVNKPKTFDIDELLKLSPPEERVYRHRCVEGLVDGHSVGWISAG